MGRLSYEPQIMQWCYKTIVGVCVTDAELNYKYQQCLIEPVVKGMQPTNNYNYVMLYNSFGERAPA
jgi:hypothetical protein